MFLLRYRRPRRYGAALDHASVTDVETMANDAATVLDEHCDEIAQLDDHDWTDDPPADTSSGDADGETPRA
jgi:hypothetical protein